MVEYAVVSYWNKRQSRMRERRRKRGESAQVASELPLFQNFALPSSNNANQNYVYRAPGLLIPINSVSSAKPSPIQQQGSIMSMGMAPDCDCR